MTRRLLLLAVLMLLVPAPAYAGTWSAPDRSKDVTSWVTDPEPAPCGSSTERAEPADRTTDLTRVAVHHGEEMLRVSVRYRDLEALGGQNTTIYVRTPEGGREVSVFRSESWGEVQADLTRMPDYEQLAESADECGVFSYTTAGGGCPALSADLDSRRDRLSVVVPRRCLGSPRWVRVGVTTYSWTEESPEDLHLDTWTPRGATAGHRVDGPYGPRVAVGRPAR